MDPPTRFKDKEQTSLGQADRPYTRSEDYVMESVPNEDKEPVLATVPLECEDPPRYLHGFDLAVVMLALLLSMFLV